MSQGKGILRTIADFINPYGWITKVRNKAFDSNLLESRSFGTPTICIGNISVGGTGKTPHTEYLIRLLKEKERVAVLSRGYGRKSKGYIKATADTPMPIIGDEPFQIKQKFPDITVAVCEKRVVGAESLLKEPERPTVILLDDAYQHRHIKAGLNILLMDSNRPIWNDCILPFGLMRESAGGARRADVVIITKCSKEITPAQMQECKDRLQTKEGTPVFFSTVEYGTPYPLFPDACSKEYRAGKGTDILLLTGIAKPAPLKKRIEQSGAGVTLMQYPDHHNFSSGDIENISEKFCTLPGNRLILTTEKDATRLRGIKELPQEIKSNIYVIPIEVKILNDEEKLFNQIIIDYVTENSRNS